MKRVVSVSLGSSRRDKVHELDLLGQPFRLERRGVDGDFDRFRALVRELDGKVDCFGLGGADLALVLGTRRYVFREIAGLVAEAKVTPFVDGGGLKHTLERDSVAWLAERMDLSQTDALLVSAVDRFGMAQALAQRCRKVVYGDLVFGVGVPIPIRSERDLTGFGRALLPIVTRLPFRWFYPTGEKQETRTPKAERLFQEAELVCGDWHYIRRYAPDRMPGKTVLTQTLREADIALLRQMGVARVVTTTPQMGGESFATNVLEAAIVALLGRPPESLTEADYREVLSNLGWSPGVIEVGPGTLATSSTP